MDLTTKIAEKVLPPIEQMTEGEIFIAEYLKNNGIKYQSQAKSKI